MLVFCDVPELILDNRALAKIIRHSDLHRLPPLYVLYIHINNRYFLPEKIGL